jgi:hypothetical protein
VIGAISINVIELQRLLLVGYPSLVYTAVVTLILQVTPTDTAELQEW